MRVFSRTAGLGMMAMLALGCSPNKDTVSVTEQEPNLVEIVARGLQFEAPDTTLSGWTTLRLRNESQMVHFALVQKLPEGIGIAEQQKQVAPVFQEGMNFLNSGDVDAAMQTFAKLPAWFQEVTFFGGPGLVSGGEIAETTTYLEPGTYLIECYIKTGGVFHSYSAAPDAYGMVAQLNVTENLSPSGPPEETQEISLSAADGIDAPAQLAAGRHVVRVNFIDQKVHENFVGHDLHVVELQPDTDREALYRWMDWRDKRGMETPAPARFIGGTNEMPGGRAAYLHLDLAPGTYMWIGEVPGPESKSMAQEFVVR